MSYGRIKAAGRAAALESGQFNFEEAFEPTKTMGASLTSLDVKEARTD